MIIFNHRISYRSLICASVISLCFAGLIGTAQDVGGPSKRVVEQAKESKVDDVSERKALEAAKQWNEETLKRLRIQPGTSTEAKDYYGRISTVTRFTFDNSTLDGLLAYMGYSVSNGATPPVFSGLLAKDLEVIPSFVLMPQDDAAFATLKSRVTDAASFDAQLDLADFQNDRALVSRFFAPKIATYYDQQDPFTPVTRDTIVPGWRKLVRLKARAGSSAETAGIRHLYLLFNVKKADPDVDPFESNESLNNQVILVPVDQDAQDSCYFAVYASRSKGYPLSEFLAADFDLPGHVGVTVPGAENGKYFVPRSCAECHGHSGGSLNLRGQPVDQQGQPTQDFRTGVYRFTKPNYLDTDQWYDWMEFDFRQVTTSLNDVVFDGGKAHGSSEYSRAMGVIRVLNSGIRDETFNAEQTVGVKSYQTLAAEKWLSLHSSDLQRAPYSSRGFGTEQWGTNRDELRLVRLLDNHCFRCHSSLRYNVFDKAAVRQRRFQIKAFLTAKILDANGNALPGFKMPQGRVLEAAERDEIIQLINTVFP